MNRFQHPSNNSVLRAPDGMTISQCSALSVTRGVYEDGTNSCISFWKPTQKELEALNNGYVVALEILGTMYPPVSLSVYKSDKLESVWE